ncbi:MAG: 3-hydroxyacyl-ACP dehydratase FabZ [Desulfococcaceae bacterium]
MFDISKILEFLPHRYPFVMIDRVVELESGQKIKALKNVTINEPYFQGHFPGEPIMPGALIIEAMGQAGAVLVTESRGPERHGSSMYFMGFDKVRFRKPVVPGDQLILEVSILKMREKVVKLAGTATVDGQLAAEAELLAAFGEKK